MNWFDYYRNLIAGKRVIFVGPSPLFLKDGLTPWIDKFDIVIRTNGGWQLPSLYPESYGSRTDILYTNVQHTREYPHRILPVEDYNRSGIQLLKCKAISPQHLKDYNKVMLCDKVRSTHPTGLMGILVCDEMLSYGPSEYWMTGVDFYVNTDNHAYVKGYQGEKVQKIIDDRIAQNKVVEFGHGIQNVRSYFWDKYKSGLLHLDDKTSKILEEVKDRNSF